MREGEDIWFIYWMGQILMEGQIEGVGGNAHRELVILNAKVGLSDP